MIPRSLLNGPVASETEIRARAATFWIQTPCGLAGPYPTAERPRAAARPLGFPVVKR